MAPSSSAPLRKHRAEVGAAAAGEIRVEGIQVHPDRAAIHRQRRQDVALPREGDEPEPVTIEILDEPARLAHGALEPVRRHVLREHGAADVHREHQAQRARLGGDLGPAQARAGEPHHRQQRHETEEEGRPASPRPGGAGQQR